MYFFRIKKADEAFAEFELFENTSLEVGGNGFFSFFNKKTKKTISTGTQIRIHVKDLQALIIDNQTVTFDDIEKMPFEVTRGKLDDLRDKEIIPINCQQLLGAKECVYRKKSGLSVDRIIGKKSFEH